MSEFDPHERTKTTALPERLKLLVDQDVELRLEVSLLKTRMRVLEETVLAQEGVIERLKRLVGVLQ